MMIVIEPKWNFEIGLDEKNKVVRVNWEKGSDYLNITNKNVNKKITAILRDAINFVNKK